MNQKTSIDNRSWEVRKRAFSIWQHTPHKVAPISETEKTCQSCGTIYQGNFCPRCGQSFRVGRFSFKTAFLLFLDIWGIGNRGMFRSIRDLMLRPGYMIRDYVRGCQSAYFPPFKMFFILATFSVLLNNGFSLNFEEEKKDNKPNVEIPDSLTLNGKQINNTTFHFVKKIPEVLYAFEKKNPSLFAFMILLLISAPLYLFFRRCPSIPDLRYSEHVVALVYTSNMYTIYQLLAKLTPFHSLSGLIKLAALIMIFISLKQFTGYSKRRLLGYIMLTFLICLLAFLVLLALTIGIVYIS